jgi:hypothetical protein
MQVNNTIKSKGQFTSQKNYNIQLSKIPQLSQQIVNTFETHKSEVETKKRGQPTSFMNDDKYKEIMIYIHHKNAAKIRMMLIFTQFLHT